MPELTNIAAPSTTTSAISSQTLPDSDPVLQNKTEEQPWYLPIQKKLAIGAADDPLENEADEIADTIMRMPEQNFIQRKCAHCRQEEENEKINRKPLASFIQRHCTARDEEKVIQQKPSSSFIQRKESAADADAGNSISDNLQSSRGHGSGMEGHTKDFMESRFSADFSAIKIHTNDDAAQMNRDLSSKAFAIGNDIYFNQGEYQPHSSEGKHLLAHELTHTIQQQGATQTASSFLQRQKHPAHRPTSPVEILNTLDSTDPKYKRVVTKWSDQNSIWNLLENREAKINFVRFILSFDKTNCVPYNQSDTNEGEGCSKAQSAVRTFKSLCMGYAAQVYSRYTSTGRMTPSDERALKDDAFVIVGKVSPKFYIPIKIVTVPGHAFNAVLIGDDPHDPNAWLFFEPQNDKVFFNSDEELKREGELGILTIGRFTDYSAPENGVYRFTPPKEQEEIHFFLDKDGNKFSYRDISKEQGARIETTFRNIFIANDVAAYPFYTTNAKPPQTYEQFIASSLSGYPVEDLALAFSYLDGRYFKKNPDSQEEIMTRRIFLGLVKKPGLELAIPEPEIPSPTALQIADPFDPNPDKTLQRYDSHLREAVISPLFRQKADATSFYNRLDSLSSEQKSLLVKDDIFFALVRKYFAGKSLWVVFSKLDSNDHNHEPWLRLDLALLNDDARLLADMLSIVVLEKPDDRYFAFLRDVALITLKNNALLPEILRLIAHRNDPGISEKLTASYPEVHYEKNDKTGRYELKKMTGHLAAYSYFSGKELRIIVRLRFVNGDDKKDCPDANSSGCSPFLFGKNASKYDGWQTAIKKYWNNKFTITNGQNTYDLVFVPLFLTETDAHSTTSGGNIVDDDVVNIRIITDNKLSCSSDGKDPGRANESCWFINKDTTEESKERTVAHEFGHVVGASDEYNLPGSYEEITKAASAPGSKLDLTGVSPEDKKLSSIEGIEGKALPPSSSKQGYDKLSLMGDHSESGQVYERHLTRFIRVFNTGRPQNTPPFIIHKIN